ncbi:MAG: 5-formyltetrahydrofolate cyclo-ligase [Nitrospinota bacterium]|nr:5-formyltetrahydrofolate cyclo-ligase [Nitrospinota bacterium]
MDIASQKSLIRKGMLAERDGMGLDDVESKSSLIAQRFFGLDRIAGRRSFLFYADFRNEVKTGNMIRRSIGEGIGVYLPTIDEPSDQIEPVRLFEPDKELVRGKWGITVSSNGSAPIEEIDLVLLPGIAFDRRGGRLGFGKGYYDRFLSRLDKSVLKVGLCYRFQLLERLPLSKDDVPVDVVITEEGVFGKGV